MTTDLNSILSADTNTPSGAALSDDAVFRYLLWRRWGPGDLLGFVMLNPSTADASVDDPTIRRCMGFARRLDFDGILVANRFAFRATDPRDLPPNALLAVGPENEAALDLVHARCRMVIAAWGAHPMVTRLPADTRPYWCLGRTTSGAPRHPLYMPNDSPVQRL